VWAAGGERPDFDLPRLLPCNRVAKRAPVEAYRDALPVVGPAPHPDDSIALQYDSVAQQSRQTDICQAGLRDGCD
jgi:hypothetical protein